MSKWKCQVREKVGNNPKRKCDNNNTRTEGISSVPGQWSWERCNSLIWFCSSIQISYTPLVTAQCLCLSRKGDGGFCSSGFSVLMSFPQTQRKKGTENISAGNTYCSCSKVSTDQNYEKNCRIQDGVGHRELVFQDSTIVTLSSLPSSTTKMAPAGPAQIQNLWMQQAALDTFCLHIYKNQN